MSKQKQRRSIFNSSQVHTSSTVEEVCYSATEWGAVGGEKKDILAFLLLHRNEEKAGGCWKSGTLGGLKRVGVCACNRLPTTCLQTCPGETINKTNTLAKKYKQVEILKWTLTRRDIPVKHLHFRLCLPCHVHIEHIHTSDAKQSGTTTWMTQSKQEQKQEAASSRTRTWDVQHVQVWPLSCLCKPEHNLYVSPDTWLLFSEKEWRNNRTGQGGWELELWIRLDCHIRNRQTSNQRALPGL